MAKQIGPVPVYAEAPWRSSYSQTRSHRRFSMKRLFALGLVLAGLFAVPGAARAWNGNAPAPSVLGVNFHGGPSVLGVRSGFAAPRHFQRPHILAGGGRRPLIVAPPTAVVVVQPE